jgi:hypothetical protein
VDWYLKVVMPYFKVTPLDLLGGTEEKDEILPSGQPCTMPRTRTSIS